MGVPAGSAVVDGGARDVVDPALGFAGTWRALGAKPAPYLRNE